MKLRTLLISLVATGLVGCGPGSENNADQSVVEEVESSVQTAPTPPAEAAAVSAVQVTAEMEALSQLEASLTKLGCFACHAVSDKRIGPNYREIAERYRGQEATEMLVNKIISGGGGVWSPMPMTSHPHLTPEVLTPLVEQILRLDNN